MDEMVMVVDSDWLNKTIGTNSKGLCKTNEEDILEELRNRHSYVSRSQAEHDTHYKQVVSYCLICFDDEVFLTRRTTKQNERRLHNCYSIGIGGHIAMIDSSEDDAIAAGMQRELYEEVKIDSEFEYKFIGLINDNVSEVNSVHVGLCYIFTLSSRKCEVREKNKMTGCWIKKDSLKDYMEGMESWSIILSHEIGAL